jgi:hypothetical protein
MFKLRYLMILLAVSSVLLTISGCSGSSNPAVTPDYSSDQVSLTGFTRGINMGEFTLQLDSDNLTASIRNVSRNIAFDVTPYVRISITGLVYDSVNRIWDIDVNIQNPTPYSAYGPWIVFTQTGQQKILDQDGFIYLPAPAGRCPVIAFAKENTERIFNANSTEPVHLRIHWPVGCESFYPLSFFIDVSYPNQRQQPIVEQLNIQPTAIPESYQITAYSIDWQKEPGGVQYVWVDLRPIGGSQYYQMFDDGAHGDGAAKDNIYGVSFLGIPPDPGVVLTVHAIDMQNYQFENDVVFGPISNPDCEPMEVIAEGPRSGISYPYTTIIRDHQSWITFWEEHNSTQAPPDVDFTVEMVVVACLGQAPSSGYYATIDCVKFIGPPLENMIRVDYTKHIPGPTCITMPVITTPFQIVKVATFVGADNYTYHEDVYPCD